MIRVEIRDWTSRVLDHGRLGIAPEDTWKLEAYEEYRSKLRAPDFPCFFGQAGETRGEMLYTFIAVACLDEVVTNMQQFVRLIHTSPYQRSSLIAFLEPESRITDHAAFVSRFWEILQFLHEHDDDPATERPPDHPLWEFSFEHCEMFAVGASPTYRRRRSRNFGPGIVLVFQPRSLFIDPATLQPIAADVRRRIHDRMLAYDGMPVHPDIGFYGDITNREWKQYALPDDNEPSKGACPFRIRAYSS